MSLFVTGGLFVGFLIFVALLNIKQINEYQTGVLFVFGKYRGIRGAGWHIIIPIIQSLRIIDLRLITVDVEGQETMTKDNVSVHVNAVIYYKIADAARSVLKVQSLDYSVSQLAQTTMRNVIGEATLDEVLVRREQLSKKIKLIVDKVSDEWGVRVENVELKDIVLPESLKRTMAKVAEADRERKATILKAEGEVVAAENLAKAANLMRGAPGALHLRTLNSINDLSSDQSNTVVFAMPMEILRAMEGFGKVMGGKDEGSK